MFINPVHPLSERTPPPREQAISKLSITDDIVEEYIPEFKSPPATLGAASSDQQTNGNVLGGNKLATLCPKFTL